MDIHTPDAVTVDQIAETLVYVDLFNGSERSKVEMSLAGGDWLPLEHTLEVEPLHQATFNKEAAILAKSPDAFRQQPKPKPSTHLWKAKLAGKPSPGIHLLKVRGTDASGKLHESQRVIRILEAKPTAVASP